MTAKKIEANQKRPLCAKSCRSGTFGPNRGAAWQW